MKLVDILSVDCIKVPAEAADKQGVINELVDMLALRGKVSQPAALKEAVWTREQTRTTGIGHGLAIPHGKSAGVNTLAIAIAKPNPPMEFAAIDGKPVRLVILLASPPDRTSDHIQALAGISKLMSIEEFRQKVYVCSTAVELYELFKAQEAAG